MMRKNSKNVLVGFLVSGWLIGMIVMGNVPLTQIPDEEGLTEIKSSGIKIENEYDFSKGTMENVSIDENGCLSLEIDQAAASLWADLAPSEKPSARYYHSMVYDSDSQKVILFGGDDFASDYDETWTYDLGTNLWTNMNPTIKPSARHGHSMVYDSDSQKVILFGGWDGDYDSETWTYDLGTNLWTNMNPTIKPGGRAGHSMVYDSDSQKVISFGGQNGYIYIDETWTYDLGTNLWTNMNPTLKPSGRYGPSMVYDSDSQKVILFGGCDTAGRYDETWKYDLGTNLWMNMNPTIKPSARYYYSMVYDSDSQKVILFGGWDGGYDSETWTYDLGTNLWTNMNPTLKPSGRFGSSMVYDSDSQKVILFGGRDSAGLDDETWIYSLNRYFKTGLFNSQLMDVEYICPITGEISWNPSEQPAETVLELQVGFSNTTDEADFVYTPFQDSSFIFEGTARYIKYHAYFESDPSLQFFTPYIETVSTYYTLGMPDYMEVFLTYLDGNATLLDEVINQLKGNATLLETIAALATQNIEYLNSLNATLSGNITLLREIVDQLGIVVGDADYDGLSDLDELEYGTNLLCSDTDCDNLNDAFEIKYGTDPLNDDSDGDTWLDGVEVAAGTDPKDADDYPGAPPPDESSSWLTYAGIGGGVALVGVVGLLVINNKKK